jgi:hypothetical protein
LPTLCPIRRYSLLASFPSLTHHTIILAFLALLINYLMLRRSSAARYRHGILIDASPVTHGFQPLASGSSSRSHIRMSSNYYHIRVIKDARFDFTLAFLRHLLIAISGFNLFTYCQFYFAAVKFLVKYYYSSLRLGLFITVLF